MSELYTTPKRVCSIENCDRPFSCRGLCHVHYMRLRQHGDVNWLPPTPLDRFWANVRKTETCWEWTGSRTNRGYGRFSIANKSKLAHRFAYEVMIGPIPKEKPQIDHLCRVRHCVNPAHLEPVTNQENGRRGDTGAHERNKTHCPYGHAYTESNIRRRRDGGRDCRECMRRRSREHRARLKASK